MDKKYSFLVLAILLPSCVAFAETNKKPVSSVKAEVASGSQELHVLNVQDYISEDVEEAFETYAKDVLGYTNCDLIYETTDTPETMHTYLKTGKANYDLICPSDYMIQRMGNEGLIEPLDLSLISTNTNTTDEEGQEVEFTGDEDNYSRYVSRRIRNYLDNCFVNQTCYNGKDENYIKSHPLSIGYMWGTLGILFNPEFGTQDFDETVEDMQTWDVLWNSKYRNTMTCKDSMRDTFAVGVIHAYSDDFEVNGETRKGFNSLKNDYASGLITGEEYNKAIDRIFNLDETYIGKKTDLISNVLDDLLKMKSNIRGLEVDTGKNDITTGMIGTNVAWSGDAVYSMELAEEEGLELWYSVPEEGANIWFDGWCMPKNEKRSDAQRVLAMEFLNFISHPSIAALNMDETGYTSFIGGDSILELAREWYDCRYDAKNEEFVEYSDEEIQENVANGTWQEVDLSYFFNDTLVEYEDKDMFFYTDEENTGFYLPYKDDGNISCGTAFFCQYPDENVINRCCVMQDFGEYNETITKMWEKFKSTSLETWAIILLAVEASAAVGLGVYFLFKKRNKMSLKEQRKNND